MLAISISMPVTGANAAMSFCGTTMYSGDRLATGAAQLFQSKIAPRRHGRDRLVEEDAERRIDGAEHVCARLVVHLRDETQPGRDALGVGFDLSRAGGALEVHRHGIFSVGIRGVTHRLAEPGQARLRTWLRRWPRRSAS